MPGELGSRLADWFGQQPFIRLRTGRLYLRELTDQMLPMKQLKDVTNRVSYTIGDSVQESAALQQSRAWLIDVADLVRSEGLTLRTVSAMPQPIEQPQELATV